MVQLFKEGVQKTRDSDRFGSGEVAEMAAAALQVFQSVDRKFAKLSSGTAESAGRLQLMDGEQARISPQCSNVDRDLITDEPTRLRGRSW